MLVKNVTIRLKFPERGRVDEMNGTTLAYGEINVWPVVEGIFVNPAGGWDYGNRDEATDPVPLPKIGDDLTLETSSGTVYGKVTAVGKKEVWLREGNFVGAYNCMCNGDTGFCSFHVFSDISTEVFSSVGTFSLGRYEAVRVLKKVLYAEALHRAINQHDFAYDDNNQKAAWAQSARIIREA